MRTCRLVKGLVFIGLLGFACFPAPGAAGQLKLLSAHAGQRPRGLDRSWPAVLTHTHNWRFREGEKPGNFDAAEQKLAAWRRRLGIKAVGVGSAWNPQIQEVEKDIFYLTPGEFRQDFPNLQQSVVPPQAFRLDDLRKTVRRFDYELK